MTDAPDFIFRPAVLSDLQGVLDVVPGIYDGMDYVPDQWQEFINNPDFIPFVACVKDEIASIPLHHLSSFYRMLGVAFSNCIA